MSIRQHKHLKMKRLFLESQSKTEVLRDINSDVAWIQSWIRGLFREQIADPGSIYFWWADQLSHIFTFSLWASTLNWLFSYTAGTTNSFIYFSLTFWSADSKAFYFFLLVSSTGSLKFKVSMISALVEPWFLIKAKIQKWYIRQFYKPYDFTKMK